MDGVDDVDAVDEMDTLDGVASSGPRRDAAATQRARVRAQAHTARVFI